MFRTAFMAAALAAAFPAHADADPDALRAELQEMKSTHEARVQAVDGSAVRVQVFGRDYRVAHTGAAVSLNEDVTVMLRPESVALNGDGPKELEGTVRQTTFAGTTVEYVVDVGGLELLVTELGDARDVPLEEGMRIPVRLNADRMHLLSS